MATKNQPVKEVRLGRIKAVIWKNPGSNGNGPLLNTTLARLYKEPESDTWKETPPPTPHHPPALATSESRQFARSSRCARRHPP